MKVLFIGGTGVISSACTDLAINMGIDLYLLNRGNSPHPHPKSAKQIRADIRNKDNVKSLIAQHVFDVVVNWIVYDRSHVENDFELFKDKTSQYIFISSASAYQKTSSHLPIKETNPLNNPFWEYSQKKIQCENYLLDVYEAHKFPVTIVRPSHTYDKTKIPLHGGFTTIDRMQRGKKIIIHDSGTSLWTLTHHKDFANGFLGLIGNSEAIGEAYHITSDEVLTWNEICEIMGEALGMAPQIIHIPSEFIRQYDKEWGDGLLGDKAHNMVFDNSKIKKINPTYEAIIPFREGAKEIISWYMTDESRKQVDGQKGQIMDEIIKNYVSV